MKDIARTVRSWFDDRLPVTEVQDFATHKTVPTHRYSVFYYLGGMTMFFFVIQIVTGIMLMLYYRPSADGAFDVIIFGNWLRQQD